MSDLVEQVHVDEIILDDEPGCCEDPFSPVKLLGVALAGALGAVAAWYAWNQLEPDRRAALKESLVTAARSQVRHWGEDDLADG